MSLKTWSRLITSLLIFAAILSVRMSIRGLRIFLDEVTKLINCKNEDSRILCLMFQKIMKKLLKRLEEAGREELQ